MIQKAEEIANLLIGQVGMTYYTEEDRAKDIVAATEFIRSRDKAMLERYYLAIYKYMFDHALDWSNEGMKKTFDDIFHEISK